MSAVKVFGREPAFYVGLVEAVLALLLSLNVLGLTTETVGAIVAVVVTGLGFYTAYVTKDTLLGVGVGLTKAVAALGVAYGLNLSENTTVAVIAVVTVLLGSYQRTQTSPTRLPGFGLTP